MSNFKQACSSGNTLVDMHDHPIPEFDRFRGGESFKGHLKWKRKLAEERKKLFGKTITNTKKEVV